MIVLDTSVLVYAVRAEHPLQSPCRRLLTAIADRTLTATTTPEVVQEFVHVGSRRRDTSDAVLAATARRLGAHALVSADQRFSRVSDIRHVVPDSPGVDGLLRDSD